MSENITIGVYGIQDVNQSEIATISHDHCIAIVKNGMVLFSLQLERTSRKKHSANLQTEIYSLLKQHKLINTNSDFVFVDNILGRSFINEQGNIRFEAPITKTLATETEEGLLWYLDGQKKAHALCHELAHIGSCLPFFGAFKNNSLLIHFDGGASKSNFSAWLYKNNKLTLIEYGWELKWLSALYNANALVFGLVDAKQWELNSVPGKFMGFASLGKYDTTIEKWLKENAFFENIWKSKKPFYDSVKRQFGIELKELDQKHPFIQNVAATVQHIFIEAAFAKIKSIKEQTQASFLYYSGGSALNILLNTRIVESALFDAVFIPPCCNDSGLALGAAAFFEWEKTKTFKIHSPYLNNWNIDNYTNIYSQNDIVAIAKLIIENKVIGFCNEQAEVGPRALGNRSIICLASDKELAKKVSMAHKNREWYRPVAPIMLEKNTIYFTGKSKIDSLSKYMLLDFKIDKEKAVEIQGAVHADGTARIQTIFERDNNPFMFDLLDYLDKTHQVRALINTSFNYKGEPIVHTIDDALKSAKHMQLDAVVLNGKLTFLE